MVYKIVLTFFVSLTALVYCEELTEVGKIVERPTNSVVNIHDVLNSPIDGEQMEIAQREHSKNQWAFLKKGFGDVTFGPEYYDWPGDDPAPGPPPPTNPPPPPSTTTTTTPTTTTTTPTTTTTTPTTTTTTPTTTTTTPTTTTTTPTTTTTTPTTTTTTPTTTTTTPCIPPTTPSTTETPPTPPRTPPTTTTTEEPEEPDGPGEPDGPDKPEPGPEPAATTSTRRPVASGSAGDADPSGQGPQQDPFDKNDSANKGSKVSSSAKAVEEQQKERDMHFYLVLGVECGVEILLIIALAVLCVLSKRNRSAQTAKKKGKRRAMSKSQIGKSTRSGRTTTTTMTTTAATPTGGKKKKKKKKGKTTTTTTCTAGSMEQTTDNRKKKTKTPSDKTPSISNSPPDHTPSAMLRATSGIPLSLLNRPDSENDRTYIPDTTSIESNHLNTADINAVVIRRPSTHNNNKVTKRVPPSNPQAMRGQPPPSIIKTPTPHSTRLHVATVAKPSSKGSAKKPKRPSQKASKDRV